MVIDQVTDASLRMQAVPNPHNLPRESLRLLLADDSPTVRLAVSATLKRSGYTQLQVFDNGAEAWNWIERTLAETGSVDAVGDLLISDVEMPQIDGFHLTKRIKEHPQLKQLPVLLYSSIVTPDNHKKGAAVGADAQVSKPELAKVVQLADELILKSRRGCAAGEPASAPAVAAVHDVRPPIDQSAAKSPVPVVTSPVSVVKSPVPAAASILEPPAMPIFAAARGVAPRGIDPSYWATFHQELRIRVAKLGEITSTVSSSAITDDRRLELLRTLHTIKSAAMVIPCEEISHVTHLVESVLDSSPDWPGELFGAYLGWLELVATTDCDPDVSLRQAAAIESSLSEALATRRSALS
jgi:CheY-like chemotaxis protein